MKTITIEIFIILDKKCEIPVLVTIYEYWTENSNIISVKTCISSISIASNFIIGKEKKVPIKGETERSFHFRHHRGMIRLNIPPPFLHLTLSFFVFCVYIYVDSTRFEKVIFVPSIRPLSSSIPLSHPFISLFVHQAIVQEKKAVTVRFLNAKLCTVYIIDW